MRSALSPMRMQNAMARYGWFNAAQLEGNLQIGGNLAKYIADVQTSDHVFAPLGTNHLWR